MSDIEGYARRYVEDYESGSFETRLVEIRRGHVIEWLERYGAHRILEVGCGLDPLFDHARHFESWSVVEVQPQFAQAARDLAENDARVDVVTGRLEDHVGALSRREFDFVVASSVVHEVADPIAFMRAIGSVCGGETIVHVNVPNARSFHRLLGVELRIAEGVSSLSDRDLAFGHDRVYDSRALEDLLVQAGFRVIDSGTWFLKPFTHDQMDALLATGAFPPNVLDGLDGMTRHLPDLGVELFANMRRA